MHILDTDRLRLRTIDLTDAPFYLALLNQPSFYTHIGDRGIRTLGAAREAIAQGPCAMQRRLGFSLYLVERRADGMALGACGLIQRDSLPDVDLGYAMLEQHAGHGYISEAGAAVLAYGRYQLGLPRVLGVTGADNAGSIRVLSKLGMRLERTVQFRSDGPRSNLYRIEWTPHSG